jgi:ribosome silencing factor RsfS/YbeB/iojap
MKTTKLTGAARLAFIGALFASRAVGVSAPARHDMNDELARIAHDQNSQDVVALDVRGITSVTDFTIIATGSSDRQMRGVADSIVEYARRLGQRPLGVCGTENSLWIIVDFVDVVFHIFAGPYRTYYDLELETGQAMDAREQTPQDREQYAEAEVTARAQKAGLWIDADPVPPWQHSVLIAWAGMRGVVSLAAAFALPIVLANRHPFPGRSYILFLTFCVILTTLVFQGLTLPLLIRKLGVQDDGMVDAEERRARLQANEAAVDFIEKKALEEHFPEEVMTRVRAEYCDRIEELNACCQETGNPSGEVATPIYQRLQHGALQIERQTIIALRNSQAINDEALRRIQRDLDLAEARLTGD